MKRIREIILGGILIALVLFVSFTACSGSGSNTTDSGSLTDSSSVLTDSKLSDVTNTNTDVSDKPTDTSSVASSVVSDTSSLVTSTDSSVITDTNTTDVSTDTGSTATKTEVSTTTHSTTQTPNTTTTDTQTTDTRTTSTKTTNTQVTDTHTTASKTTNTKATDTRTTNTKTTDTRTTNTKTTNTQTTDTRTTNTHSTNISTSTKTSTVTTDVTEDTGTVSTNTTTEVPKTPLVAVPESEYYGYQWIQKQPSGNKLAEAYRVIADGCKKMQATIPLDSYGLTVEQLSTVYLSYYCDYPQHFWVSNSYSYSYNQADGSVVSLTPGYTMDSSEKDRKLKEFNAAADKILSTLSGSMSKFDLEKAIHDYLVLSCTYREADNSHNAYGALVNGICVCEGYAKSFLYLCREAGIPCLFVTGGSYAPGATTMENHAWNIVQLDGEYYHVDVTWDDAGEPTKDFIFYEYFNVSTAEITRDHILSSMGYVVPDCRGSAKNYHVYNQSRFDKLSVDSLIPLLYKTESNQYVFRFRLTTPTDVMAWIAADNHKNGYALAAVCNLNGFRYSVRTLGLEVILVFEAY